jgi:hypothetical protein
LLDATPCDRAENHGEDQERELRSCKGGVDESVQVLLREAAAGRVAGQSKGVGVVPHAEVVGLASRQVFPSGPT